MGLVFSYISFSGTAMRKKIRKKIYDQRLCALTEAQNN